MINWLQLCKEYGSQSLIYYYYIVPDISTMHTMYMHELGSKNRAGTYTQLHAYVVPVLWQQSNILRR